VKIGRFVKDDTDLRFHEVSEGNIIILLQNVLSQLNNKFHMGAPTQIRVYDDKMNIWNDGSLPAELSLESLRRPHSSKPRNPIVADVCFKGGLIDAWGRGIIRIIDSCKQAELPEPELIERDGGFLVTLFKNNLSEEQLANMGLNPRQIRAVLYVKEKGKITNLQYLEINSEITDRTALRDLDYLVEIKVLRRIGEKKSAYYELNVGYVG
jgi:ATP-dependent DNA helicase RecG